LLNVSGFNERRFQEEDSLRMFEGNPCSKYKDATLRKKILVSDFEFRYRRSGKIMLGMADEEYAVRC
jgi:hypothetical protein